MTLRHAAPGGDATQGGADDEGLWHLLVHTAGPNADPEVPFFQADWFPGHRRFHAALQEAGSFVAAGPLPERDGAGQTLVRGVSTAEITRLARETDPAVIGGYLVVEIVPWRVVESVIDQVARARIPADAGADAVAGVVAGASDREVVALAVRYLLQVLGDTAPGNTLEVRVPPFGAAQVVEGPRHTRGTPPNVVEMDAATWVALATGSLGWDTAVDDARVSASGSRADLREWLPLDWATIEG